MAETTITVSSPTEAAAAQKFSRDTWHEAKRNNFFGKFMGAGSENIIQVKNDLTKGGGDVINFSLIVKLSADGIANDGWIEGNEESMSTKEDSVLLGKLSHGIRLGGSLTEQRPMWNLRDEAKSELARWFADKLTEWIFKKLTGTAFQARAGTSAGTAGSLTNIGESATSNTNVLFGGDATTTATLDESDTFSPDLLEIAKVQGKTGVFGGTTKFKMRPVIIDGLETYIAILHPWQIFDLKKHATYKEAMLHARERAQSNPIFTGAVGIWDGVAVFEHDQVPIAATGGAGSDVDYANALFLGAQAGCLVTAQESPDWVEKTFNYGQKYGIMTGMMMGFDKTVFNSLDFSVIVLRTAAKDPTAA